MAKKTKAVQEQENVESQSEVILNETHESGIVVDDSTMIISTGSIDVVSSSDPKEVDKTLVKIRIEYPKDYQGKKFYSNGDIKEVSPESANQFIEKGIATRVD